MAFCKITKNKAYYKRFQTKFRRRREAKTDYYARKNMVSQDLNKYSTPKYRLVARITNNKVIAQIVYSTLIGDKVLCEANSQELRKFGLNNAFTSYSAAYATGLLLARRVLKAVKLDKMYSGAKATDGNVYDVSAEASEERRPLKAILDIGIRTPSVGNRVFAVLKGACDGGVHVPHSTGKFPGFSKNEGEKDSKYDASVHRDRIFGKHIDEYMTSLKEENNEAFKKQFGLWEESLKKNGVASVEALFTKIFAAIRNNSDRVSVKKDKKPVNYVNREKTIIKTSKGSYPRLRKLTSDERKARVAAKKEAVQNILKSK